MTIFVFMIEMIFVFFMVSFCVPAVFKSWFPASSSSSSWSSSCSISLSFSPSSLLFFLGDFKESIHETKKKVNLGRDDVCCCLVESFLTAALFSCFCFPDSWFSRIDCCSFFYLWLQVLFFIWFWFILLEPKRDESFFFAINKSAWLWSKIKKQTWLTQVKPVCLPLRLFIRDSLSFVFVTNSESDRLQCKLLREVSQVLSLFPDEEIQVKGVSFSILV